MRILCPERFHDACVFAEQSDAARAAEIAAAEAGMTKIEPNTLASMRRSRGSSVRSLLQCFSARANSERLNTKDLWLPDTSFVIRMSVKSTPVPAVKDRLVSETLITGDMSPHSFFFRETWFDRLSGDEVEIHDKVWYVFDKSVPQEKINELCKDPTVESLDAFRRDEPSLCRKFFRRDGEQFSMDAHTVDRVQRRVGMCGGIIYHPDWVGGKQTAFGSWSTHT